jgi:hypothetical protein
MSVLAGYQLAREQYAEYVQHVLPDAEPSGQRV